MLSTSLPSASHFSLTKDERAGHASSSAIPTNVETPWLLRLGYTGEVAARGVHALAFCTAVSAPGLPHMARQVRRLTIDFDDVRPAKVGLDMLADALAAVVHLEELTLLGMPARDSDGWVLRRATFSLRRFSTNLSLTSKDVLDFLRRQPGITALITTAPPASDSPQKSAYQHMPFPHEAVPSLRTLDCPAPFLLSLLAATPPTRPLTNIRIDLNRLSPLVESEALRTLATFSSTVRRLSLCRSVLRSALMSNGSANMNMGTVVSHISVKRRWPNLQFLEMRDGIYDASSIPTLAQSISECFPSIKTLIWAPSCHPTGSSRSASCIAVIFYTFCRHLEHFIFLDDASNQKYMSVLKQPGGELHAIPISAEVVENMWQSKHG